MTKIKASTLVHDEIISGLLLLLSFTAAICIANIASLQIIYRNFIFLPIYFGFGQFVYQSALINIVNDGLMSLFFLLIGLELKFHLVYGEFQNRKMLVLPLVAALGGIIMPACIYLSCNFNTPTVKGWAIPIATDTAFMLGILSFFGRLISNKLRAFIVGFSLIDDALALCILAIFYTKSLNMIAVYVALGWVLLLFCLNRFKVKHYFYYLGVGIALWVAMVEAGIHGALSGAIVALAIPVQVNNKLNRSFRNLEHILRPLVYFLILPLFAFINSGINFHDFSKEILMSKITMGIILGLFVGKQLGIFSFSYVAVQKKWGILPEHVSWEKFYAVSILGGIGFTLSLFIGDLTFELELPNYAMRSGVIIGSLLSLALGIVVLMYAANKKKEEKHYAI